MKAWLARFILKTLGWRWHGVKPDAPKYLVIGAPHTSNLDFFYYLGFATSIDIKVAWLGKKELFRGVMGPIMRFLGGIPVERSGKGAQVSNMVQAFASRSELVLAMMPEGTRSYTPYWKSGFYHIAHQAQIPIALCCLDYAHKTAYLSPLITLTGDIAADMQHIAAFYAGKQGLKPENAAPVRLKPADSE